MAKRKKNLQRLLASYDTFGNAVIRFFNRLPEDFFKRLQFAHWHAIHLAAAEALKKAKKRRVIVKRLENIRKIAFKALRRKTRPRPGKAKRRAPTKRMFVETNG